MSGDQVRHGGEGVTSYELCDIRVLLRGQNRRARFEHQETLEDYLDHDYDCPDLDLNKPR